MAERLVHCVGYGDMTEDVTCLWDVISDVDGVAERPIGVISTLDVMAIASSGAPVSG
jgi:hypothetical protein